MNTWLRLEEDVAILFYNIVTDSLSTCCTLLMKSSIHENLISFYFDPIRLLHSRRAHWGGSHNNYLSLNLSLSLSLNGIINDSKFENSSLYFFGDTSIGSLYSIQGVQLLDLYSSILYWASVLFPVYLSIFLLHRDAQIHYRPKI